jgi:hypothetical protein
LKYFILEEPREVISTNFIHWELLANIRFSTKHFELGERRRRTKLPKNPVPHHCRSHLRCTFADPTYPKSSIRSDAVVQILNATVTVPLILLSIGTPTQHYNATKSDVGAICKAINPRRAAVQLKGVVDRIQYYVNYPPTMPRRQPWH